MTQDNFDIVPVCALAKLAKLKLIHPNEIPGYAPDTGPILIIPDYEKESWQPSTALYFNGYELS